MDWLIKAMSICTLDTLVILWHPFHPFLTRRLNKNKLQVLPELLFQSTPKLTRLWVAFICILYLVSCLAWVSRTLWLLPCVYAIWCLRGNVWLLVLSVRAGWLYWPVKTSSVRLWMAFPLRKREATPAWTYYMNCPSMKTVFTGSCPCVFLASVWMKPTALLPTARFLLLTVQKLWVSRSMVWWKNEKKRKLIFTLFSRKVGAAILLGIFSQWQPISLGARGTDCGRDCDLWIMDNLCKCYLLTVNLKPLQQWMMGELCCPRVLWMEQHSVWQAGDS